ncbi:MAG TPA: MarR family transcriptional regulator [Burkholderiaceae bacterium]
MDKRPSASGTAPADERVHELAVALRIEIGRLRRRLREQADNGDIVPSQVDVVRWLETGGPSTVTALARLAGMRPQSMGANVAALEAAGLVAGAPDPADGRQTLWSLTPHCREWIRAGREAREDWLSRTMAERFGPAELDELSRAIALLRRLADR